MGYEKPPWIFTGRALYQLQLVKSDEARKYIPEHLKIVDFFGYTLGGFYLARYNDSPVGSFDELVALAGIVWNPPTSCAWAARVFVNDREAQSHGVKSVGLPSRVSSFQEVLPERDSSSESALEANKQHAANWWKQGRTAGSHAEAQPDVQLWDMGMNGRHKQSQHPVCTISALPMGLDMSRMGPRISLSLPSFAGGTPEFPSFLKYSCCLDTNVRPVAPARIMLPDRSGSSDDEKRGSDSLDCILGGRPLVALAFDEMKMHVDCPEALDWPAARFGAATLETAESKP